MVGYLLENKVMKKLKDSAPSPYRLVYNNWLLENARGEILDIGKSKFWDYSDLSYCYKTIDNNPETKPDILGDICHNNICYDAFDVVLCNGMYEFVSDPQKMVDEVWRILKPGGKAIFGFVGEGYKPYKKEWRFYKEGDIDFSKFKVIWKKNIKDNNYYFISCEKS